MKPGGFIQTLFDFIEGVLPAQGPAGGPLPEIAIKKRVRRKLIAPHELYANQLLSDLCQAFPMGYRPELIWKGLRVTAGMAYYQLGRIALSHRVLRDENQVRRTLIHEYAHLLAVHRDEVKGKGHGEAWKQAMRDLGEPPEVRHQYEVERNRPKQTLLYKCNKCGSLIPKSRKFPKGRRYLHVRCGGAIVLHRKVLNSSGK